MSKSVATDPAQTAHEVFSAVLEGTESFEHQDIGTDLAYLLGAIVDPSGEGIVDWDPEVRDEPPALLAVLRERLPKGHVAWKHIVAGGN